MAIDRQYLGFADDLNRQQIKKLRKASYAFMTTTFITELTERFAAAGFKDVNIRYADTGQSDQDPIIIEIYYGKLTEKENYLRPGVLVEVGCRSLREPTTQRAFSTLVAENFSDRPFADKLITIPIVNPERTFLEKIFLLHEEFQKAPERMRVDRLSRHLYDIEKLSQSEFAEMALSDAQLYRTIVDHRKMFTALAEVDYNNHSPDKIAFVPPPDLLPVWEADYKQMQENMIFGEVSSFKVLMERLTVLQAKINKIEGKYR